MYQGEGVVEKGDCSTVRWNLYLAYLNCILLVTKTPKFHILNGCFAKGDLKYGHLVSLGWTVENSAPRAMYQFDMRKSTSEKVGLWYNPTPHFLDLMNFYFSLNCGTQDLPQVWSKFWVCASCSKNSFGGWSLCKALVFELMMNGGTFFHGLWDFIKDPSWVGIPRSSLAAWSTDAYCLCPGLLSEFSDLALSLGDVWGIRGLWQVLKGLF